MKKDLLIIGIMTGNSLDAADVVLTLFKKSGEIKDLEFHSKEFPEELFLELKSLRAYINESDGDMYEMARLHSDAHDIIDQYMKFVSKAVLELIMKCKYSVSDIDLVGFHGQTCAHKPPFYTVQIGDGQMLANAIGIPVVYDFRSDDVMNGGQGAPFAPKHCADFLKQNNDLPITFINGGNSSNIAHSTFNKKGEVVFSGWDAGPFNHFPDMLVRKYTDKTCDVDGEIGKAGNINTELLKELFYDSAGDHNGENFLLAEPAKSSGPKWYKSTPMLDSDELSLEDKVKTAEYFAAYLTYHSLGYTVDDFILPSNFALFGGGWKNPVVRGYFEKLIAGEFSDLLILPEHKEWFDNINGRMVSKHSVKWSDEYGFNSDAMEARICADVARCYVENIPFTTFEVTGVLTPVRCGIIAYPNQSVKHGTLRWSRASAGWEEMLEERKVIQ